MMTFLHKNNSNSNSNSNAVQQEQKTVEMCSVPETWGDFVHDQVQELPHTLLSVAELILFAVIFSIIMIPVKYYLLGM